MFGWGIGDILTLSRLAVQVYTAYRDAPDELRNISDEVKSLQIIIDRAKRHFQGTTLSSNNRQEGREVLKGCQNILEDLNRLIEEYNGLAGCHGLAPASASQALKRVKLSKEDIATLRSRLISNTGLLSAFIHRFDISTFINKYTVLIPLF